MKEYPKELKQEAIDQHASGVSVAQIAETFGFKSLPFRLSLRFRVVSGFDVRNEIAVVNALILHEITHKTKSPAIVRTKERQIPTGGPYKRRKA